ncbi:MAG: chromosomal replication initiator protein DnaA [Candidatus Rhabdochlamydia sp.]
MLTKTPQEAWSEFLEAVEKRCSTTEFQNWFAPIRIREEVTEELCLEVPNIFVQEYLINNYKKELSSFLSVKATGELGLSFTISEAKKDPLPQLPLSPVATIPSQHALEVKLNPHYTFQHFIEGPSNQFVKSAAVGIATRPGKSYTLMFIHGGVGLGKTHILHSIGHQVRERHKKLRVYCITTEAFINDLVDNLRNKSLDRMKRFYRSLDVLLVDDIQFLQNRPNFEEEFCNTFESLINQGKQIVITSDKPPGQLKLSERLIARMEWGLVANVGIPDLETRVAILQHKAEQKGFRLPQSIAFFIAEHIYNNVRQLEGAINRLNAYCRLMNLDVTQEVVESTLGELFQASSYKKISVDNILKSVATIFGVRISDLKSATRSKDVSFPRQVAMYLAKELINDSLMRLASAFGGKTHSTLLHAWKKIAGLVKKDERLRRQIDMARRNLEA